MTRQPDPCMLCGNDRPSEVSVALIRWAEPRGRLSVTAGPRCRVRAACRGRVEANGDEWPVADPDPRPRDAA